jgi:hypothetical protein
MLPPPVVGSSPSGVAPRVLPGCMSHGAQSAHLLGAAAIAVAIGNRVRITSGALSRRSPGVLRSWRPPVPDDYPGRYGSSGPQVYSGAAGPPAPDRYPGQYELLGPRCTPVLPAHQLQTSISASAIRSVPRVTPVLAAHQLRVVWSRRCTPAPAATHPKTAILADTPHKCIEVQLVPYWAERSIYRP